MTTWQDDSSQWTAILSPFTKKSKETKIEKEAKKAFKKKKSQQLLACI